MTTHDDAAMTNGSGAAALLAAGLGAFALSVLAIAGDKSAALKAWMIFYKPTGPLSGVTTTAIVVWLACWVVLEWRWRGRTIAVGKVCVVAMVLLGMGVLLTFPPIGDLF